MANNKPKARPTVSVGITGHRPNKLPSTVIPRIQRQLRVVMAAIDDCARRIASPATIRLISSFAEGADQIAVNVCPPEWSVEAILPFAQEEYLKDFEQSAAGDGRDVRGEFLASLARASVVTELPVLTCGSRSDSYLAAGRAMLDGIDVLIAVWDGEEPQHGGTGMIVEEACEQHLAVVWLSTKQEREPVVIERFEDGVPVMSTKPWPAAFSLPARPTPSGRA